MIMIMYNFSADDHWSFGTAHPKNSQFTT